MKLKHVLLAALSLAVLAVLAWLVLRPQGGLSPTEPGKKGRLVRRTGQTPTNAREAVRKIVSTEPKKPRRRPAAEMFENLKGKDRKLAEDIQLALDNDNYAGVIKSVDAAMRSTNPEVRSHLVDALSWFGAEALPELTALMADPDEDVAESAQAQWTIALAEIESPGKRMAIGLAVLATLTDQNMLADISGEVSNAALEYIDGESDAELQGEKRVEVVQALLDIMEGSRPACVQAAAETYEELTGHEWMGVEEAERYLENPDDYEPPEDVGEGQQGTDVSVEPEPDFPHEPLDGEGAGEGAAQEGGADAPAAEASGDAVETGDDVYVDDGEQ